MSDNNKSVLIIDDSPTVRRLVELILSQEGYEVLTAEDGHQGIEITKEKKPSLILVDFLMPRMNGYQFCKIIRSDENFKNTPIILITAKGEDVGQTFEEKFGVMEYFQKPFEPDELAHKVNEVMGKVVLKKETARIPELENPDFSIAALEDTIEKIIKKYFKYELQVMLKNILIDTMKEMEIVKKESLAFSGQIAHITMPDILQFVDHAKLTGKLSVLSQSFYSETYIENGLVVFSTLSKKGYHKFVTDFVIDDGKMTKEELLRLLEVAKEKRLPIGRVLVERGYITEEELMDYLKKLTRDSFFFMVEADSGNFYFEISPVPLNLSDIKFRLPMPGLILDGLRRFDEKKVAAEQFSDDTVVLARLISNADEIEAVDLDEHELAVFSQIDGRKTLREIIEKSRLDELEVKRICYSLQKVGLLKIKDKERREKWQQEYL
jgi:CheY-like chemotaxis protein